MPYISASVDDQYAKNENLNHDEVKILIKWVEDQLHLPTITELQAILFLQCCDFDSDRAKLALDKYFTARTKWRDLFHIDLVEPMLKLTTDTTLMTTLPRKTSEGYSIIFTKYVDPNPNNYHLSSQFKLIDIIAMLEVYVHGTNNGFYILMDFDGACFGHMFKFNYFTCKRFLYYLQEAMPIKLKGLFFINVPSFTLRFINAVKPLLKSHILDLLKIYATSYEDVYEYVPREYFPRDYEGGQAPSVAELLGKVSIKPNGNFPKMSISSNNWDSNRSITGMDRDPLRIDKMFDEVAEACWDIIEGIK